MDELKLLQDRYLELINQVLPQLAKERQFPIRYNHCFGRIVLDNLFGCCWYEVLSRKNGPAYKQLNQEQLKRTISIAEAIIAQPQEYIVSDLAPGYLNVKSLLLGDGARSLNLQH